MIAGILWPNRAGGKAAPASTLHAVEHARRLAAPNGSLPPTPRLTRRLIRRFALLPKVRRAQRPVKPAQEKNIQSPRNPDDERCFR